VKIAKKLPDRTVLDITLKEGRNRQVRRMLAKLGHKVRELTRIKFGPLEIGNLKPGAFRMLNKFELKQLRDAVERAEQRGKERAKKPDGKSPVRKPQVPDDD
jgi:16S rRNA U516 pseudouridylate synthase RsuA-like enzyme